MIKDGVWERVHSIPLFWDVCAASAGDEFFGDPSVPLHTYALLQVEINQQAESYLFTRMMKYAKGVMYRTIETHWEKMTSPGCGAAATGSPRALQVLSATANRNPIIKHILYTSTHVAPSRVRPKPVAGNCN